MIDLDYDQRVLYRRRDVGEGEIDGDLLLFSATDRRLHQLNRSAASIWGAVGGGRTCAEIVGIVADEYAVEPSSIRTDVIAVLESLAEGGLVRETDEHTAEPAGRRAPISAPVEGAVRVGPVRAIDTSVFFDIGSPDHPESAEVREKLERALAPLLPMYGAMVELNEPPRSVAVLRAERDDDGWSVHRGERAAIGRCGVDTAVRALLTELNVVALEGAHDSLVLHAASIEFEAGVVVFPGVSNAGKSTLAAQLVERGHRYVTDEATACTAALTARPFHKSLCLEPGAQRVLPHLAPVGGPTHGVWDVDPRSIGPGLLSSGGPIVGIVFPRYTAGGGVALRPLAELATVELLLENAFDFAHLGASAFERIAEIARTIPCFALDHGGQPEVVTLLERQFG